MLKTLVIGEPSEAEAEVCVAETAGLAATRLVARHGAQTLSLVETHQPEALILSLEIERPSAKELLPRLLAASPDLFIIATYRELNVKAIERFGKLGIHEFIEHPLDYVQLYRAASARFNAPFRRHLRHSATLEVYRQDGVMIGRTRDISAGGLSLDCLHPVNTGTSLLVDIHLSGDDLVRTRVQFLSVEGIPPMPVVARAQFANLRGQEKQRLSRFLAGLSPAA